MPVESKWWESRENQGQHSDTGHEVIKMAFRMRLENKYTVNSIYSEEWMNSVRSSEGIRSIDVSQLHSQMVWVCSAGSPG